LQRDFQMARHGLGVLLFVYALLPCPKRLREDNEDFS
jgi:hypothetical protein